MGGNGRERMGDRMERTGPEGREGEKKKSKEGDGMEEESRRRGRDRKWKKGNGATEPERT